MRSSRDVVVGCALALLVLVSPRIYEHLAYRATVERLAAEELARAGRAESLRKARECGSQPELLARRLAALHVGASLPVTLRQLGEVAFRAHLTPSAVLVLPPVRVDVERGDDGPVSWLEEFPVQVTVPGSLEGLLRYVEALGQAPLPLRVDWMRVNEMTQEPARGAVLKIGLRLLVPARQG